MRRIREGVGEAAPRYYRREKPLPPPPYNVWKEVVIPGLSVLIFWTFLTWAVWKSSRR